MSVSAHEPLKPVRVLLRDSKPRRNELLAKAWERLDGITGAVSTSPSTIEVHLQDPQAGAKQLAGILHEYTRLISFITDSSTWRKCTEVLYETDGPDATCEIGVPLNEMGTFGNLIVEVSEILSEESGRPQLYFMLMGLVFYDVAGVTKYKMEGRIPLVPDSHCYFAFRLLPDKEAAKYYDDLGEYLRKYETSMYQLFRIAADLVLRDGSMDHRKLLDIAYFVEY